MNIAMINCGLVGSTGKIMMQTANQAKKNGENILLIVSGLSENKNVKSSHPVYTIGSEFSRKINVLLGRITGFTGCFAYFSTKRMIRRLRQFKPDVLHLHNLHESYINLPVLFQYIKKNQIKTVWTFHDCWPFTGHCAQFEHIQCQKWKTGCRQCALVSDYPKSLFDNSRFMYKMKNAWFTGIPDMTIVTPSQWLARLVSKSFLQDYPVKVINNGIDINIFQPTDTGFLDKYMLRDKKIVLGVSFGWGDRKGLDVFIKLAARLDDDYQIVLVGTDESIDKRLPGNIISIHRTHNQQELAGIYSAADVFVNPTRQDNYPTVNMEAIACGTPVVTFRTGGSPEMIDSACGTVVEQDDIDELYAQVINICEHKPFSVEDCLNKAKEFDKVRRFKEYVQLYQEITTEKT